MSSPTQLLKRLGANRAVLALSVARMGDALGNSILFILIPLYIKELPKDHIHLAVPILVGILISVFGFVTSLFQPLMGALSDKLNRRKLLIQAGLAIIAFSTLLFVFAQNYTQLFVLRLLQGVGVGLTIPASLSLMTAITKKETRGGSMSIFSTFRMIGFAIGPVVGGYLQVHYGFDAAFYTGSGFLFLAMLLVQIWVKEVEVDQDEELTKGFKVFDRSLYSAGISTAALSTFVMACCFSMVTTLENQFNARLDITALGFSIAFSMLMVGRLISQVPLGYYSDSKGRKPFILGGLILMAISTVLLGEVQTMTELIILRLVQGLAAAAVAAPAFALAGDVSQKGGEGRQMSVITMGFGLGIAVGPLLAGLLAVFFFELPFWVIGALTLAGTGIVYKYMPETVQGGNVLMSSHQR